MKDMKDTGKAEKHGKLPMAEVMVMGTLKENIGKINKGLRWKLGTRVKIHSKDGVRRKVPHQVPRQVRHQVRRRRLLP
jgi:hypothetical protein